MTAPRWCRSGWPRLARVGVAVPPPTEISGEVERLGDAVHHLQTPEILVPGFDAVHRALAGAENVGKLGLRQATMLARIPNQAPIRSRYVSVMLVTQAR